MFSIGSFFVSEYYYGNEKWFSVRHRKKEDHHTHIPGKNGYNSAKMIAVRAFKGVIPKHYPLWMVESINRLWFGKDFKDREDIDNTDLYTNDPEIRVKKSFHKRKDRCLKKTRAQMR